MIRRRTLDELERILGEYDRRYDEERERRTRLSEDEAFERDFVALVRTVIEPLLRAYQEHLKGHRHNAKVDRLDIALDHQPGQQPLAITLDVSPRSSFPEYIVPESIRAELAFRCVTARKAVAISIRRFNAEREEAVHLETSHPLSALTPELIEAKLLEFSHQAFGIG